MNIEEEQINEDEEKLYEDFYELKDGNDGEQQEQKGNGRGNININKFIEAMEIKKNKEINKNGKVREINFDLSVLNKIYEISENRRTKTEYEDSTQNVFQKLVNKPRQDFVKKRATQVATAAKKFYQQNHHINISNVVK